MARINGVSLFASSGIGDLAVRGSGIHVILANELIPERAELFSVNYPETEVIVGDIWEKSEEIINSSINLLMGEDLDFLIATPPCQGMSKNGQGKLLAEIRAGNRPSMDPRNRLIIPTINIVLSLRPKIVVFENVPEMANTMIVDDQGNLVSILDFIDSKLQPEYKGKAEVVEFANFGVPQKRQRLITIYSRIDQLKGSFEKLGTYIPEPTHSQNGDLVTRKWVNVREAIGTFPPLDAISGKNSAPEFNSLHRVPILDPKKYEWIKHTPSGKGAFDNQCVQAGCLFQGNPNHGSSKSASGVNQANLETPLYCIKCGSLLPRPFTEVNGTKRLMRGFTSAYKRMSWENPAPTLTTNLSYPSSDQNVHPDQNRVLSLYEALTLHTVSDYEYSWRDSSGKESKDGLIRDSIGESVPPKGLQRILSSLVDQLSS